MNGGASTQSWYLILERHGVVPPVKNLSPVFASCEKLPHIVFCARRTRAQNKRRDTQSVRRSCTTLPAQAEHPCAHIHCVEVSELPQTLLKKRGATRKRTRAASVKR